MEHQTQKLFLQLRTQMLDEELEKHLIAKYLDRGIKVLEDHASGQPALRNEKWASKEHEVSDAVDAGFEALGNIFGLSRQETREKRSEMLSNVASGVKEHLADKDAFLVADGVRELTRSLKRNQDISITTNEEKALSVKLTNAYKTLIEVESALAQGDWTPLESLKDRVSRALQSPYNNFKNVLDDYKVYYYADKSNVKDGTKNDMEVECRVLLEIIGNISIDAVNTLATLTKLKTVLLKYPKNKVQRYGERSIHSILKTEKGYEIISPKTANEYLKRLNAVMNFAIQGKLLSSANVVSSDKYFKINSLPGEERKEYDKQDLERLVDALCTKPLYGYKPNKNCRFWIILIAVFHGFRLSNITGLTKKHIIFFDEMFCFDLNEFGRAGVKTKNTAKIVPIHWALIAIGFLDWVDRQKGEKLFLDSADQFSDWYNRREERCHGFESKYVTDDPKKCLYSIRHNFAAELYEANVDMKAIKEAMGHAPDKKDVTRARYLKRTVAVQLRDALDKMRLDGIDLDRLEARAKELFNL
jgi:integrase